MPQTHENEHVSILSLGLIVSPADPTPYSAFGDKFSNILYIVALYSKHSRALTFKNLCSHKVVQAQILKSGLFSDFMQ